MFLERGRFKQCYEIEKNVCNYQSYKTGTVNTPKVYGKCEQTILVHSSTSETCPEIEFAALHCISSVSFNHLVATNTHETRLVTTSSTHGQI
jgi:hypothetical protein